MADINRCKHHNSLFLDAKKLHKNSVSQENYFREFCVIHQNKISYFFRTSEDLHRDRRMSKIKNNF